MRAHACDVRREASIFRLPTSRAAMSPIRSPPAPAQRALQPVKSSKTTHVRPPQQIVEAQARALHRKSSSKLFTLRSAAILIPLACARAATSSRSPKDTSAEARQPPFHLRAVPVHADVRIFSTVAFITYWAPSLFFRSIKSLVNFVFTPVNL